MTEAIVDGSTMRVSAKSGLNVRTKPNVSARKVKTLVYNSIVNVYEQYNGWSAIDENQWVSSDYLLPHEPSANDVAYNPNIPQPYPQLASDIGYKDALNSQLKQDEGSELECYLCSAGKATIGIGHNLQANGLPVDAEAIWAANPDQKRAYDNKQENCWEGLVITEAQEKDLFNSDIEMFEKQLTQNLAWYPDLPANPRCSLTNMCFNMGWDGLSQFVNMLAALEAGDYDKAAQDALDSQWATQVGDRSYRVAEQMSTPS